MPSSSVKDPARPVSSPTQYGTNVSEVHVLVGRFRDGDQDAFAVLYRRYQPQVFAYVQNRVRNMHLAEDLTAEAFTKAVVALPQLQVAGDDLGGWLKTIAKNVIADHFRAVNVRPAVDLIAQRQDFHMVDQTSAEDAAIQRDQWRRLLTAVGSLSPQQRTVVVHRLLLGRTSAQTAADLGCHEMNVKHVLRRARRRLAQLLPQEVAVA